MDELLLIENGKSEFSISVDLNATETDIFAADELQNYLDQISGVRLPVHKKSATGKFLAIGKANADKLGIDVIDYTNTTAGDLYRLAKNTFKKYPEVEGIFISCMSMRAMDAIQPLETDLEVPVVTSDQATLWKLLRFAGVKEKIDGYGRLLCEF